MKTLFLLVILSTAEPVGIAVNIHPTLQSCQQELTKATPAYADLDFVFACVGVEFEV